MRWNTEDVANLAGEALCDFCADGNLPAARWVVGRYGLNLRGPREEVHFAFQEACRTGRLDVVAWLVCEFGLDCYDVVSDDNAAVKQAIRGGHADVARWLKRRFGLQIELPGVDGEDVQRC